MNRFVQLLYTFLISILVFYAGQFPWSLSAMGPSMGGDQMGAGPSMSEEEMFESLMAEIESTMKTDEERIKFRQDVTNEIMKVQSMTQEERDKYVADTMNEVNKIVGQPARPEEQPTGVPAIAQPIMPAAPSFDEKLPEQPKKKPSKNMAATLEKIIEASNAIDKKIAPRMDMDRVFKKLGEKGRLRGWSPTITWESFQTKKTVFINTLSTIKSTAIKGTRPYLDMLNQEEQLCTALTQFEATLSKYERLVKIPSSGLGSMGDTTKNSIVSIINNFFAMFELQKQFDAIIQKNEAALKKAKEEAAKDEAAAKAAAGKKPQLSQSKVLNLKAGEEGYYNFTSQKAKDSAGYPFDKGDYPPWESKKPSETSVADGKKQGAKAGEGGAPKEEKKSGTPEKKESKETERTKELEKLLFAFEKALEHVSDVIETSETLDSVKVARSKQPEKLQGELEGVYSALKSADDCVLNARGMVGKVDDQEQKNRIVSLYKKTWREYKSGVGDFIGSL